MGVAWWGARGAQRAQHAASRAPARAASCAGQARVAAHRCRRRTASETAARSAPTTWRQPGGNGGTGGSGRVRANSDFEPVHGPAALALLVAARTSAHGVREHLEGVLRWGRGPSGVRGAGQREAAATTPPPCTMDRPRTLPAPMNGGGQFSTSIDMAMRPKGACAVSPAAAILPSLCRRGARSAWGRRLGRMQEASTCE